MEALVISDIGKVEFVQVNEPSIQAEEVLLSVKHVGICGSDLNTYQGLNPLVQLPRIPGHEIGGVISDLGNAVPNEFKKGMSAIVVPYTECGKCPSCLSGKTNACQFNKTLGVQQEGGLAEKIAVHHERLILNDKLPAAHLAVVEPLSVGFHAVERAAVKSGEHVIVFGAGMIGVGAMIGAMARGATVIAVEVSEAKRETLKFLGIEHIINPLQQNTIEMVQEITSGRGADVAIEAVGLPDTFRAAVDVVCFGGRVAFIGYAKENVSFETKLFNLKELDIYGSRNARRADFIRVISYLEAHADVGDALISKVFSWREADQVFEYWKDVRDKTFKIIVDLSK